MIAHPYFHSAQVPFWVRLVVALLLVAAAGKTMAAAPTVELEVGRRSGAGAAAVFAERIIGSARFALAPGPSAGWIDGRNGRRYRRSRYTTADQIPLVSAGARPRHGTRRDRHRHLSFRFQAAPHAGRTQVLSSAYEFVGTLGWQGKRFSIQVGHVSKGSLHEPSCGGPMLLMGIRFDL